MVILILLFSFQISFASWVVEEFFSQLDGMIFFPSIFFRRFQLGHEGQRLRKTVFTRKVQPLRFFFFEAFLHPPRNEGLNWGKGELWMNLSLLFLQVDSGYVANWRIVPMQWYASINGELYSPQITEPKNWWILSRCFFRFTKNIQK